MTSTSTTRHTFAILVTNEPGILSRVVGLFSGRGYNIESLTVACVDPTNNISRIHIVTSGTRMIIDQIKAQLERLIPVHKVVNLTDAGPVVEREMALIKVVSSGTQREEALRIADIFRARIVDTTLNSLIFEITGTNEKLDNFIGLLNNLGATELVRTGIAAITRGEKTL